MTKGPSKGRLWSRVFQRVTICDAARLGSVSLSSARRRVRWTAVCGQPIERLGRMSVCTDGRDDEVRQSWPPSQQSVSRGRNLPERNVSRRREKEAQTRSTRPCGLSAMAGVAVVSRPKGRC